MILSELTDYLAQHRRAALTDMANRFGSSPDALRAMLDVLVRKGRVRRIGAGPACASGCCGCDQASAETHETYEWIAPAEPPQRHASP